MAASSAASNARMAAWRSASCAAAASAASAASLWRASALSTRCRAGAAKHARAWRTAGAQRCPSPWGARGSRQWLLAQASQSAALRVPRRTALYAHAPRRSLPAPRDAHATSCGRPTAARPRAYTRASQRCESACWSRGYRTRHSRARSATHAPPPAQPRAHRPPRSGASAQRLASVACVPHLFLTAPRRASSMYLSTLCGLCDMTTAGDNSRGARRACARWTLLERGAPPARVARCAFIVARCHGLTCASGMSLLDEWAEDAAAAASRAAGSAAQREP